MARITLMVYREAVKRLTEKEPGMSLDMNCPGCGYPEMSGRVKWPEGEPLGLAVCHKCFYVVLAK